VLQPSDSLAGFIRGPTSKRKEGNGKEGAEA